MHHQSETIIISRLSSFWYNLPLRTKGAAVIAIPVACLVTSLTIFANLQQKVASAQQWVEHTHQVRLQTGEIFNLLIDAENGLRGYSLTKQQQFFESHKTSVSGLTTAVKHLENLIIDNPNQVNQVQKVERLIAQRIEVFNRTLKLVNDLETNLNVPTIIPYLNRGKAITSAIRQELDAFNKVEEKLLAERQEKVQSLEKTSQLFLWLSCIIGVAGGLSANYLYSLGIVKRMGKLQNNAQRLALGEPLVALIPGQDEISQLDRALYSTAEQIAQREVKLREANGLIAEAAKREKALIENSLDVICSIDIEGKFVEVSPACLNLWGYAPEELVGRRYIELVVPEDEEKTQEIAAEIMAGNSVSGFENRYRCKDGSSVDLIWSATWSETEQLMFCVARDNTQQKEIEQLKNDFISTVNHEIRTPLTSLCGFSELLLNQPCSPEKQRRYLTIISEESKRLTNLINDFLDLQRMESGRQNYQFERIDIAPLLREAICLFDQTSKQHALNVVAPRSLPLVKADSDRIYQVVSNLISNAIKYSPQGGEVTLSAYEQEREIAISITDQGVGIAPEAMEKLFTKFYRVDNASTRKIGGTGLGLALVKQIVEDHNGRVWVESTPGQGSTFYFTLPKAAKVPSAIAKKQQRPETIDVLVVEDDTAFAQLMQEHLEHIGLTVITTAFAEEALQLVQQRLPRLVILDILLPGSLDGWDFLIAIKSNRKLLSLPVLIATVTEPNIRGLALRGADYLLKPISPEILVQMVQYYLPQLSGKTLLVVDDDPRFRQQVREILASEAKVRLIEATNGKEALEQIQQRIPDLLILDLIMPEMDGFEVLRQLRTDKQTLNLPVLVVTGFELSLEEKDYIKRRMAILVNKQDTSIEGLIKIVEQALGVSRG